MNRLLASVMYAALVVAAQPTLALAADAAVQATGGLRRVEIDQDKNGKVDTVEFWDATRLVRVEVDGDGDGRVERWEHRTADNKLDRLGSSGKDDGVEDMWSYFDAAGKLLKVEFDTDRDGLVDKRDTFVASPVARDLRTLVTIELGIDKTGQPARRLHYRPDGSFDRVETIRQ